MICVLCLIGPQQDELAKSEFPTAVLPFLAKVVQYRPRIVAFVGVKIANAVRSQVIPVGLPFHCFPTPHHHAEAKTCAEAHLRPDKECTCDSSRRWTENGARPRQFGKETRGAGSGHCKSRGLGPDPYR